MAPNGRRFFSLLPASKPNTRRRIVVEQLRIADVAPHHADRAMTGLLHDGALALAGLGCRCGEAPARSEWPDSGAGSKPASRAPFLMMSATLWAVSRDSRILPKRLTGRNSGPFVTSDRSIPSRSSEEVQTPPAPLPHAPGLRKVQCTKQSRPLSAPVQSHADRIQSTRLPSAPPGWQPPPSSVVARTQSTQSGARARPSGGGFAGKFRRCSSLRA